MKEQEIISHVRERLGITEINEMQLTMLSAANTARDIILLSPTGGGKTLAYVIPMLKALKPENGRVQAVIIAPSRELTVQIYNIIKSIIQGHKVTCCFGGHNVLDEKKSLEVVPSVIVSTPGRLLDHIKRGHIDVAPVRILILDEFDKSLELGFQDEMKRIIKNMPNVSIRHLTSATMISEIPEFLKNFKPVYLNFLKNNDDLSRRTTVYKVLSPIKDKLNTLKKLLFTLPIGKTIVFVNYRESVDRVVDFLNAQKISCGAYHGALDQIEREKSLALFNNGSFMVLVTTDIAARGLDIKEIEHIVHYHLPNSEETYTHRNGRTARYTASGNVYIITSHTETIPDFISYEKELQLEDEDSALEEIQAKMSTIYFMAGRKEKISKGDIMGFIGTNSGLNSSEIGKIDLYDHYALAAVPREKAKEVVSKLSSLKIKNKKVKITLVKQ